MKVPTVEKVKLNILPEEMSPLLKLASSAVTVCVITSLFFHVTFVPALTVILAGLNVIFAIDTLLGLLLLPFELLLLLPLLHEYKNVPRINIRARLGKEISFFIVRYFRLNNTYW